MEKIPKLYSIITSILKNPGSKILTAFGKPFIDDLITRTSYPKSMNIVAVDGDQYFCGYPDGDFIFQVANVLEYWGKKGSFPICFVAETYFEDETPKILDSLKVYDKEIKRIIESTAEPSELENELDSILAGMGVRGFLTMIGVRKTVGSAEMIIPHKEMLEEKFNKLYIELSEEELKTSKSIPKLSVGGKALTKHAHRSSEKFWGDAKGKEIEKNKAADELLKKILSAATWINIHALSHSEYILEVSA